jgi:hypothetical protein
MIPGAPVFSWSTFDLGHALPQGDNSPRPVTTGAPAPFSKAARPLNARPSSDDIASVHATVFRYSSKDLDRTEARVLDAGEGA